MMFFDVHMFSVPDEKGIIQGFDFKEILANDEKEAINLAYTQIIDEYGEVAIDTDKVYIRGPYGGNA